MQNDSADCSPHFRGETVCPCRGWHGNRSLAVKHHGPPATHNQQLLQNCTGHTRGYMLNCVQEHSFCKSTFIHSVFASLPFVRHGAPFKAGPWGFVIPQAIVPKHFLSGLDGCMAVEDHAGRLARGHLQQLWVGFQVAIPRMVYQPAKRPKGPRGI